MVSVSPCVISIQSTGQSTAAMLCAWSKTSPRHVQVTDGAKRPQKGWHGLCSIVMISKIKQEEIHTSPFSCFQRCDLHCASIIRLCAIFYDATLQQLHRPDMLHWDKLQQEIAPKHNFFIISQVCAFTLRRNMLSNLTSHTLCWHICMFCGVASPHPSYLSLAFCSMPCFPLLMSSQCSYTLSCWEPYISLHQRRLNLPHISLNRFHPVRLGAPFPSRTNRGLD